MPVSCGVFSTQTVLSMGQPPPPMTVWRMHEWMPTAPTLKERGTWHRRGGMLRGDVVPEEPDVERTCALEGPLPGKAKPQELPPAHAILMIAVGTGSQRPMSDTCKHRHAESVRLASLPGHMPSPLHPAFPGTLVPWVPLHCATSGGGCLPSLGLFPRGHMELV